MSCIFLGFALIIGVATYFGFRKARQFMEQFAQKEPVSLPVVRYAPPELDALHKRIDSFLSHAQAGRTNAQLVLTARDLNALISDSWLSNHVYVTLQSNVIAGQFSVPFEDLGMPLFRGRYLNGAGTLNVSAQEGDFAVTVRDVTVNGIKLPEHYMTWLRKQNFARDVGTNAATKESLQRVGRIAVEDGQLVFDVSR